MSTSPLSPSELPDVTELEDAFAEDMFPELTLNDRCDADSAEAAVAQVLVNGERLLFCGSHFRRNFDALSKFPHSVPEAESKPFTWRRAAEMGPQVSRSQGDDHA